MKKIIMTAAVVAALGLSSCSGNKEQNTNPLFSEFNTPYGIPPFDQITIDNFREAMIKGMEEEKAEIQAIIDCQDEPTFANVIAPLDKSGELLDRASSTFGPLSSSNSTQEMRDLEKELSPLESAHSDFIYMNQALFNKVKAVYDKHHSMTVNPEGGDAILTKEERKVLENCYKRFVRGGAELDDAKKEQLKQLNLKLSELQLQFSQNLLHETNETYVTVDNVEELAGLPEANIQAAAAMAASKGQEGKYMFNMQRPSCNPVLQYCSNRDLRKKIYDAYYGRGAQGNEYDNRDICRQIVALRIEKAKLMGYSNYSEVALENRMAKTSENVYNLLDQIWTPAVAKAKEEIADIKAEIKKDGFNFEPEGWDYMYYADRAKKAKYNINEEEVSEYLEINNVLKGIFYVANKLYGLTFEEITDKVPSYEKTAQCWRVIDKDGKELAIFFSDYFPRDGKGAGAWCTSFRGQKYEKNAQGVEERKIPLVVNVCNMTVASADKPALQTIDNVNTMFHEFGHALHSFMRDTHYNGAAGVERDFVELPSQIDEHWAMEPEVLAVYAKHYKTGETIPMELVNKIVESGKYGQGFATVEYLAASLVDMDLHVLTEVPADFDVLAFEQKKLAERGCPRQIYPRYRVTNFSHTMGGGYTAGYYSYIWAEVLDCDAYEAFKETGDIFNQEVADKFRKYILTPGGIDDGMTMYHNFRGQDPKVDALLRNRGL